MRCTTVKVGDFAHLMYVILHHGRVVREWKLAGVQGGSQWVGCREAMPGSGMNGVKVPQQSRFRLDSGRSGQGRSVGGAGVQNGARATPGETID